MYLVEAFSPPLLSWESDLKDDETIKQPAWIQRRFRNLCQIKDMEITQQREKEERKNSLFQKQVFSKRRK